MIAFKPIDLSDKETVQKYTLCSPRRNCDLSFVNLYRLAFPVSDGDCRNEWLFAVSFLCRRTSWPI